MQPKQETTARTLHSIQRSPERHWVGDGFPVRTLFGYPELGAELSPFLLLDYAGPVEFPPTEKRLGVGEHPHRGFETVTIVYQGEVEHRDSSGAGGRIGPGDVQWMTAASGVVHEEFHGRGYARVGGPFEMIQLWVNLPARDKRGPPRYQAILQGEIPEVSLAGGRARARVIAGEFPAAHGNGPATKGPARTFTPLHVWELKSASPGAVPLRIPDGWSGALLVRRGELSVNGSEPIHPAEVGVLNHDGTELVLDSKAGFEALLLSGEPILEPIAGAGPFVMNTTDEIREAFRDYQSGKLGGLADA